MIEVQSKPKPTAYTLRVHNAQKFEVPIPFQSGRSDKLQPGETIEVAVTATKLSQFTANTFYQVEVIGNNSDALAAAEQDRASRIKDARNRLAALKTTLDEARAEEQAITARIKGLEDDERDAEGKDRAALREAGRSRESAAEGVLTTSTGNFTDQIRGLRFDEWGAQLRTLEAEAAVADAESLVAADEAVMRRRREKAAEKAVEEAQAKLATVRIEADAAFTRPDTLSKRARSLRNRIRHLESNGPHRVPAA